MVIAIIGENCSGKSTLAAKIKGTFGGEIITGKDYLRMAKSESESIGLFKDKLKDAVNGENVIYVITDPEHIAFLPEEAIRILVSADLDTIKERFKERMHGVLPPPVSAMLEKKHGMFDDAVYDLRYDGANGDAAQLYESLETLVSGRA